MDSVGYTGEDGVWKQFRVSYVICGLGFDTVFYGFTVQTLHSLFFNGDTEPYSRHRYRFETPLTRKTLNFRFFSFY